MESFSILTANKIFHVTVLLHMVFTIVINLWHQKFVTADVIAVFVNKQQLQHGIQRRGQNFDKKSVFKEVHSKEVDRRIETQCRSADDGTLYRGHRSIEYFGAANWRWISLLRSYFYLLYF